MVKKLSLLMVLLCVGWSLMAATPKRFTLVIDAGHGGHDTGARGVFSQEKDINLSVALRFGKLIESNCPDVKVIYTRKDDRFVTLHERAAIANRNKADLFISVHTNAVARGHTVQGFQVYTLGMHRAKDNLGVAMRENSVISLEKDYEQTYQGFDPKSSESYIMFEFIQSANMERSIELARFIQRSVCSNVGRNDKGVHQAGFLVLRETSMPSCLIELGFITTPEEENFLNTEEGQASMAEAFYKAFVKYRKKYEPQWTVPTRETKPISIAPAVTKKPPSAHNRRRCSPWRYPSSPLRRNRRRRPRSKHQTNRLLRPHNHNFLPRHRRPSRGWCPSSRFRSSPSTGSCTTIASSSKATKRWTALWRTASTNTPSAQAPTTTTSLN